MTAKKIGARRLLGPEVCAHLKEIEKKLIITPLYVAKTEDEIMAGERRRLGLNGRSK